MSEQQHEIMEIPIMKQRNVQHTLRGPDPNPFESVFILLGLGPSSYICKTSEFKKLSPFSVEKNYFRFELTIFHKT